MNQRQPRAQSPDAPDRIESPFWLDADLPRHRRPFSRGEETNSDPPQPEHDRQTGGSSDALVQQLAELATAMEEAQLRVKLVRGLRVTVREPGDGLVEGERRVYPARLLVWNRDGHELATVTVGGRSSCYLISRPDGASDMTSDATMAVTLVAGYRADSKHGARDE